MRRHMWCGLLCLLFAGGFPFAAYSQTAPPVPVLPEPPSTPAPNSIAAQMAAPWRHLPNPASDQQFKQDKAYCAMMGSMAPPGPIDSQAFAVDVGRTTRTPA